MLGMRPLSHSLGCGTSMNAPSSVTPWHGASFRHLRCSEPRHRWLRGLAAERLPRLASYRHRPKFEPKYSIQEFFAGVGDDFSRLQAVC